MNTRMERWHCSLFWCICFLFSGLTPVLASDVLHSLRGDHAVTHDSTTAEVIKWQHEVDPVPRAYFSQPPLVPHRVAGYAINKKYNKCLTCHSPANYKVSDATQVSASHFYGRDGKKTTQIAARRYFCLQCHIPQRQVKPLVENSYVPKP